LAWKIEYTDTARRQLKKMDKSAARRILDFFDDRATKLEDPRETGKPLKGPLGDFWRFRIGDYRAICDLQFSTTEGAGARILMLQIGHRREVYRSR
jgi:mRNA interferase RelE/StbE